MYPALRFCCRHSLDTMSARFEFQFRENAVACDAADNFLIATVIAFASGHNFQRPARRFRVSGIHTKQITGENRSLITAGAGTYFQIDVGIVVRVGWNERFLKLDQKNVLSACQSFPFFAAHFTNLVIGIVGHFLGRSDFRYKIFVFLEQIDDWSYARVFLRQVSKLILITDHVRIGKQPGNFLEAIADRLKFEADGLFHRLTLFVHVEAKKDASCVDQVFVRILACFSQRNAGAVQHLFH